MANCHHRVVTHDRHHGWLVHNNPAPFDVDEDVDGSQVYADVFFKHVVSWFPFGDIKPLIETIILHGACVIMPGLHYFVMPDLRLRTYRRISQSDSVNKWGSMPTA